MPLITHKHSLWLNTFHQVGLGRAYARGEAHPIASIVVHNVVVLVHRHAHHNKRVLTWAQKKRTNGPILKLADIDDVVRRAHIEPFPIE